MPSPYSFPLALLSLLPSNPGITSDPTSDVSSDAPSKHPPPSQQPSPQPQHQVPSPSPPPRSHSHIPHLRVHAQHQPISHQTTTSPSPPPRSAPTRVRPHSTNHMTSGDPRLRRLAAPSLQPRARSARDPPGKDIPHARSPLLQLGLRRQRRLLRVYTATRRRAPLRRSRPRFRPRRRASHRVSAARSHITMCARSGQP